MCNYCDTLIGVRKVVNRIIGMRDRSIVEIGTHDKLLSSDVVNAGMWNNQKFGNTIVIHNVKNYVKVVNYIIVTYYS